LSFNQDDIDRLAEAYEDARRRITHACAGPFDDTLSDDLVYRIVAVADVQSLQGIGSFEVDGRAIFFKIDYYNKALTSHSPDPTDPSVTERVITIMLAEEY
jgi:Protein of unknown function (DUF3768)